MFAHDGWGCNAIRTTKQVNGQTTTIYSIGPAANTIDRRWMPGDMPPTGHKETAGLRYNLPGKHTAAIVMAWFPENSLSTKSPMSLQSVRAFFAARHLDLPIIELEVSTATVALAAEAHGVEPGRIAKTLLFRLTDGRVIVLVSSGATRIDNRKFKEVFGRGKMLAPDEIVGLTGHPVGGVCPFGLAQPLPIYLDKSLQNFDDVLPAAGAIHSAVRISPAQLESVTDGQWVDVC